MSIFGEAKYIKAAERPATFSLHDPIPFFRRTFTVSRDGVRDARVYIQAPGFAEVFINGKPMTEDKFISPISDFSKILWYNSYDVTDLIEDGENVLSVIASNGYFNESFRTAWRFDLAKWRDAPQFMLTLKINGEDAVVSDSSFRASRQASHIIFSHLRSGEYVDMRKYDDAWMYKDYDESPWRPAIEVEWDRITGELLPTECQPVRECEVIEPVSVTECERGYLVDFGKNSSGYMEITLTAPRGQEIIFRYAEEVYEDGTPRHNRMDDKLYYPEENFEFMTNKLIASGNRDTFKPKFSYHGFRYVLIEGLPYKPSLKDMRAYFVHNDVKRKADFVSGDRIINYIYDGGMRSSSSNMFWSLTDCPTREKLGWTNDAQASCEQLLINFDAVPFFKKWFTDILADQIETGELHGVIPTAGYGLNWGPVCDYCLFELPYRIYLYTGDSSMLREAIPSFERYREFFRGAIERDYEFRLGDWLGGGNNKRVPLRFIRQTYYIKVLRTLTLAKRLAGIECTSDERELEAVTEEFMSDYLTEHGECTVDEQTSLAIMIVLGLYRDKDTLCRQLVRAAERDGARIMTGMVGIQYIYDALSEAGRPDLAYKIITEGDPGYKSWYDHGATTLFEKWEGAYIHSHNHHMFSNVIGWFFKSLLGISPTPDAPGFEKVIIKPTLVREMKFAKGYEDTVKGRIEVEWEYTGDGFSYSVTLPEGVSGEYMGRALPCGKSTFFIKE